MNSQLDSIEKCLKTGIDYLAADLRAYWPSTISAMSGRNLWWNMFSENNITLHVGRAFSGNGFHIWGEVPFGGTAGQGRSGSILDFLAYSLEDDSAVMLEMKNNVDTPQLLYNDLLRLKKLQEYCICRHESGNGESILNAANKLYGVVTVLNRKEFDDWWTSPNKDNNYMPEGKKAKLYAVIGEAIAVAPLRKVVSLKNRACSIAYAIYDDETLNSLKIR